MTLSDIRAKAIAPAMALLPAAMYARPNAVDVLARTMLRKKQPSDTLSTA